MSTKIRLLLIGFMLFSAVACRNEPLYDSELNQLFDDFEDCDALPERAEALRNKYSAQIWIPRNGQYYRHNPANNNRDVIDLFANIALIPNKYIENMFDRHDMSIRLHQRDGDTNAGITQYSGPGYFDVNKKFLIWEGSHPDFIFIEPRYNNYHAINHEIGHANVGILSADNANFQSETLSTWNNAMASERAALDSYPQKNFEEWQAEVFDSYYCSQASRERMEAETPIAWAFATQNYVPPVTEATPTPAEQDNATQNEDAGQENVDNEDLPVVDTPPTPNNPADVDEDGVPNENDQCPNSPLGKGVWVDGQWAGCVQGQLIKAVLEKREKDPKADADEDGIPNFEDGCSNTPFGSNTWTNGSWKGCSSGQLRGL